MSNLSVLFDAPGRRGRRRHNAYAAITVVVALAVLAWVVMRFNAKDQLSGAKWSPFVHWSVWQNYLLIGLGHTLIAAAVAIVLALLGGLLLGMGRMSDHAWLRWPCTVFIEFFRAVPVLLMMYFTFKLYNQYTIFSPGVRPLAATVTGLTFYNASVIAEVLRSGVASLPAGQREAGLSIGLRAPQVLRAILLPQAFTAMMPILVSQLVIVLKDSALGAAITYDELLNWAQTLGSAFSNTLPALVVAAAVFILLNYGLSKLAERLEQRLRRRGRPTVDPEPLGGEPLGGEPDVGYPDMRFNTSTGAG